MRYMQLRKKSGFFSNLSATSWIILISVFISIAGFILWRIYPESVNYFSLNPSNILHGKYLWTILIHMFAHGGFFHLFINMFVLFSLGRFCERIIGRKRFLWFYLISGIFAGVLSVFLAGFFGNGFWENVFGSPNVPMVGASGAIFAIAGLFVILLPRLKFCIIFFPFISFPAYVLVPLVLILTWVASILAGLPIGNVAHFGGFLIGLGYGIYLKMKFRKKVMLLQKHFGQ